MPYLNTSNYSVVESQPPMERVESELEEQEYGVVVENIGFSAKLVKFKFLPSAYKLCDFRQII